MAGTKPTGRRQPIQPGRTAPRNQRNKRISVLVTAAEHRELVRRARDELRTVSSYLRSKGLDSA